MAAITDASKPSVISRILRSTVRLLIGVALLAGVVTASVFTPLFADAGVALLSAYSKLTLPSIDQPASSIVILGGGLTRDQQGDIVLNHYSQSRADKAIALHRDSPLNIITSGAESPWLRDYLNLHLDRSRVVIINENASMNTCENAVFTAKLLAHHELPTTAYLVTDRYHMARARRQFARAGIDTIAAPAMLHIRPSWSKPSNNLIHSRRTLYEIAALARDIIAPQPNCRSSDEISIEEISTPRRKPKLFF